MSAVRPDRKAAKAVASGLVALAGYLVGVIPAEGGFGDVSTVQWLGAVVFLGGAYGLTYAIPNARTAPTEVEQLAAEILAAESEHVTAARHVPDPLLDDALDADGLEGIDWADDTR